jgi:hypothetical protein
MVAGEIFISDGNSLSMAGDDYDPGDLNEIDRAIRHMPMVVNRLKIKALEGIEMTGSDNFDAIVQDDPETQRARVYMAPINSAGIHEELSECLLLKAAFNMEGR